MHACSRYKPWLCRRRSCELENFSSQRSARLWGQLSWAATVQKWYWKTLIFHPYLWFYASYRNKIRIVDCKNEKKNENMKSVLIIVFSDIKRSEWWLSSSLLSASWARLDWPTREVYLRISMPREHVRDGTAFEARLMDDLRTCS